MSAENRDSMNVDELIAEYVRLATSLGSLWSRKFKPAERTRVVENERRAQGD